MSIIEIEAEPVSRLHPESKLLLTKSRVGSKYSPQPTWRFCRLVLQVRPQVLTP
ncbi:uncharacterized protein PHALS_06764 [Plasmopara halstedii]|uniref:Uncharacterized protein n=1 Tax=Plasmopara halstedii TaxID=4781 RepID=A0A0P1B3R3_PLAHL|nr:uncharacterized protein PHALS_06764 [Plasmopara halstedii]CEG48974.1 hypothetical protein PHALS_06764 [Plasmopara halstedii]|eukprot:XP_024585343.1 hypothetical protein PHALS_06764 [Plasmopara halstedii]